jgi:flagellar biosynthesis/type III secretory pathway M-ring protein FliF/YscJ
MNKRNRKGNQPSREVFEGLEEMARQKIQNWLQDLLEERLPHFRVQAKLDFFGFHVVRSFENPRV